MVVLYHELKMLMHSMSHPFSFCAVEKVLKDFRESFNACIDVGAIKYGLKKKDIISDAEIRRISNTASPTEQRELLHDHLERTCTVAALIDVCDLISAVKGNRKMKELGEDMKKQLMGKVYVHLFLHLPKMRE